MIEEYSQWYIQNLEDDTKIKLKLGKNTIGRSDLCDIRIESRFCSKRHCEIIVHRNDTVKVIDYSRNGTFINYKEFLNTSTYLRKNGDRIGLGAEYKDPFVEGVDDEDFAILLIKKTPSVRARVIRI